MSDELERRKILADIARGPGVMAQIEAAEDGLAQRPRQSGESLLYLVRARATCPHPPRVPLPRDVLLDAERMYMTLESAGSDLALAGFVDEAEPYFAAAAAWRAALR